MQVFCNNFYSYRDLQHGPVDLGSSDVSLLPELQSLIAGVPRFHTRTSIGGG